MCFSGCCTIQELVHTMARPANQFDVILIRLGFYKGVLISPGGAPSRVGVLVGHILPSRLNWIMSCWKLLQSGTMGNIFAEILRCCFFQPWIDRVLVSGLFLWKLQSVAVLVCMWHQTLTCGLPWSKFGMTTEINFGNHIDFILPSWLYTGYSVQTSHCR